MTVDRTFCSHMLVGLKLPLEDDSIDFFNAGPSLFEESLGERR